MPAGARPAAFGERGPKVFGPSQLLSFPEVPRAGASREAYNRLLPAMAMLLRSSARDRILSAGGWSRAVIQDQTCLHAFVLSLHNDLNGLRHLAQAAILARSPSLSKSLELTDLRNTGGNCFATSAWMRPAGAISACLLGLFRRQRVRP